MKITYVKGDLFQHLPKDKKVIIPHIVSDDNKWGRGFVLSLSKFSKIPELEYRKWASHGEDRGQPYKLGYVQVLQPTDNVMVANMCAQHSTITSGEKVPLRYWALTRCMRYIKRTFELHLLNEIHTVKIGSGLAMGRWDFIETLINEIWVNEGIPTHIYEL